MKNKIWRIIFRLLAILALVSTLIPLLTSEEWFVRVFDFPRLQIVTLAVFSLAIIYALEYRKKKRALVWVILLSVTVIYQLIRIYPYTMLAPKQALNTEQDRSDSITFSVLVSNVLQTNTKYELLKEMVKQQKPDVLLVLEADSSWEKGLKSLEATYKYTVKAPLSNTYGMLMYSKKPLQGSKVHYLVEDDVPSISTRLQLRDTTWINFYGVHPRPPAPGEADDSRERDAEIVLVGKMAKKENGPVVVAGDFNDVAWSETTILFQEVSSLLDPRLGRGFYNTFHAKNPLFRWPLDHIFHSDHFKVFDIKVLDDIDSDHFPIYIELSYEPTERIEQKEPEKDADTDKKAEETIQEGLSDKDES